MGGFAVKIVRCGQLWDGLSPDFRPGMRLVVGDDGRISALEPDSGPVPGGAEVVDLTECWVVPGFVDCHDHLGLEVGDEEAQAREPDGWTAVRGVRHAYEMARGGITTVRDVGGKNYLDVYWARALGQGFFPGPRVVRCGKAICRTGGHAWYFCLEISGPDEARRAVRENLRTGADFIKVMISGGVSTEGSSPTTQDLTDEEIRVLIEEAHRAGRKVAAHLYGGRGADVAVEAGLDSVEHGSFLSREQLALMARQGTFLVVTHGVMAQAYGSEAVPEFWKPKLRAVLDSYSSVIAAARELGVKVAVGGDGIHGRPDLEVEALAANGFSSHDALRAITANGAELCGLADETGTLEPGKWADLVGLAANPLEDVAAVREVRYTMRQGREQFPGFAPPL